MKNIYRELHATYDLGINVLAHEVSDSGMTPFIAIYTAEDFYEMEAIPRYFSEAEAIRKAQRWYDNMSTLFGEQPDPDIRGRILRNDPRAHGIA